jgi:hypothetical protein
MTNFLAHLVISDCLSANPFNDIQTPDLVPFFLDNLFFKFKMSEELNIGSEEIDDQPLDLNVFFDLSGMEVNETEVSNLVQELEVYTAQNFSPGSQPVLPIDCKFLINRFIFILF